MRFRNGKTPASALLVSAILLALGAPPVSAAPTNLPHVHLVGERLVVNGKATKIHPPNTHDATFHVRLVQDGDDLVARLSGDLVLKNAGEAWHAIQALGITLRRDDGTPIATGSIEFSEFALPPGVSMPLSFERVIFREASGFGVEEPEPEEAQEGDDEPTEDDAEDDAEPSDVRAVEAPRVEESPAPSRADSASPPAFDLLAEIEKELDQERAATASERELSLTLAPEKAVAAVPAVPALSPESYLHLTFDTVSTGTKPSTADLLAFIEVLAKLKDSSFEAEADVEMAFRRFQNIPFFADYLSNLGTFRDSRDRAETVIFLASLLPAGEVTAQSLSRVLGKTLDFDELVEIFGDELLTEAFLRATFGNFNPKMAINPLAQQTIREIREAMTLQRVWQEADVNLPRAIGLLSGVKKTSPFYPWAQARVTELKAREVREKKAREANAKEWAAFQKRMQQDEKKRQAEEKKQLAIFKATLSKAQLAIFNKHGKPYSVLTRIREGVKRTVWWYSNSRYYVFENGKVVEAEDYGN